MSSKPIDRILVNGSIHITLNNEEKIRLMKEWILKENFGDDDINEIMESLKSRKRNADEINNHKKKNYGSSIFNSNSDTITQTSSLTSPCSNISSCIEVSDDDIENSSDDHFKYLDI